MSSIGPCPRRPGQRMAAIAWLAAAPGPAHDEMRTLKWRPCDNDPARGDDLRVLRFRRRGGGSTGRRGARGGLPQPGLLVRAAGRIPGARRRRAAVPCLRADGRVVRRAGRTGRGDGPARRSRRGPAQHPLGHRRRPRGGGDRRPQRGVHPGHAAGGASCAARRGGTAAGRAGGPHRRHHPRAGGQTAAPRGRAAGRHVDPVVRLGSTRPDQVRPRAEHRHAGSRCLRRHHRSTPAG